MLHIGATLHVHLYFTATSDNFKFDVTAAWNINDDTDYLILVSSEQQVCKSW